MGRSGSNLDELGPRTQNYILRAANYINDNKPAEETQMADTTFMGLGFQDRAARIWRWQPMAIRWLNT